MTKRLFKKFIQNNGWLLGWLLATLPVYGGALPVADTCQHPDPPLITGSARAICRSEAVTLTATGCAGAVVWSNGETGASITVRPQQTTKYTAICRARQGCISCFAEVWTITVNTPSAPVLTASSSLICAGDAVTITATNCAGTLRWSDQSTGLARTEKLLATASYQATCEQNNCVSAPSKPLLVPVAVPANPIITIDKAEICSGQAVMLTAANCLGTVRWSDGGTGLVRSVTPVQAMGYRAVCEVGSCRSDSSNRVSVAVRPADSTPARTVAQTNGCPFQTADLTGAIPGDTDPSVRYVFRSGPTPDAPAVQSPGAVLAGTYYIFGRSADGCYTRPITVSVTISSCSNAIAACLSNPATVAIRVDTLDWTRGVVRLQGQLGGSAERAVWQSTGGGLFTNEGLTTHYLLSETDWQQGSVTFTLTTPDPDGRGACVGASARVSVTAPARPQQLSALKPNLDAFMKHTADSTLGAGVTEDGASVFIPEGFSPNGDGINDRFVLRQVPAGTTVQLAVYNRWGQVVYQQNDYKNDWDGTANVGIGATGQGLPDGTYFYRIQLSDGREFVRFLTLAR